jgi:hypothetical protein
MARRFRPKLKAPEALGGVLARAGDDRFAPNRAPIAPHVWAAAVGGRIAERTKPIAIEGGVLLVRAATSAWASELSLLSDALLARLRQHGVKVKALRFRVGAIDPPERPTEIRRARVPAPAPLDPELARSIARVEDPDLRAVIDAAARANLGWRAFNEPAAPSAERRAARAPRDAGTENDPPGRAGSSGRGAGRGTRGDA